MSTPIRGKTQDEVTAWQVNSARKELPTLEALADELEAIVRDMFTPPIAYQHLYGADVMALSFATKQLEHLRSVHILISAGQHRDAQLIARTMLETRGVLLWAFKSVPERTDLWFWYGAILDWRQMEKNKRDGVIVDPDDEAMLKPFVDKHGPNYYRPKVRQRIAEGELGGAAYTVPEDPWLKGGWTDTDVRSMFENLGEERLYDIFYRRTSEWSHSGPRAILIAADLKVADTPGGAQSNSPTMMYAQAFGLWESRANRS